MGGRRPFPSRYGASGIQDAALDDFGRVVFAQGLEPDGALFPRRLQCGILSVKAKGVPLLLQHPQKLLPRERGGNGGEMCIRDRYRVWMSWP